MRLAVFTSQYPSRTGTFFERDMRGLLEAGIDIDVFPVTPLDASLWKYTLTFPGPVRLHRERVHHMGVAQALRRSSPVWRRPGSWLADAALAALSAARFGPVTLAKTAYVFPKAWAWASEHAYQYDHVLAYWGNFAGTCAYAFHRLQGRNVPFSIWLHAGTDLYRAPAFMARKIAYADNVLTCCEFNRDYILRNFGGVTKGLADKVHVFHHGLDIAEFRFQPEDRPADRVIAVGRLAAHKGYDFLIWALHILHARGIRVTVDMVGDGPEREALVNLAADLGVKDLVRFRGWLPFAEARRAMAEATLLVHPSDGLGDGLPNVLREAMAVGTPVIASDVAGIPDAIGEGRGVLVTPRDALALADAIEALLKDRARCRAIAEKARRYVEERFDLSRNGAMLAARLIATRRHAEAPPLPAAVERRRRPRSVVAPIEVLTRPARGGLVT